MKRVAIIPARGGSKRIPGKNIKLFAGSPMISHPIRTLQESGLFHNIYVSSDSQEILDVAASFGAERILRPNNLADDFTPTIPVVRQAVEELMLKRDLIHESSEVFCVYPTNPFLNIDDLREGIESLDRDPNPSFVAPIVRYGYPIQRAILFNDGITSFREPENVRTRSQDLEETYHDAGQWYLARASTWLDDSSELMVNTFGLVIPPWRAYDIDTPEDWTMAELYYKVLDQQAMKN